MPSKIHSACCRRGCAHLPAALQTSRSAACTTPAAAHRRRPPTVASIVLPGAQPTSTPAAPRRRSRESMTPGKCLAELAGHALQLQLASWPRVGVLRRRSICHLLAHTFMLPHRRHSLQLPVHVSGVQQVAHRVLPGLLRWWVEPVWYTWVRGAWRSTCHAMGPPPCSNAPRLQ